VAAGRARQAEIRLVITDVTRPMVGDTARSCDESNVDQRLGQGPMTAISSSVVNQWEKGD
jgi:hypothetical protein